MLEPDHSFDLTAAIYFPVDYQSLFVTGATCTVSLPLTCEIIADNVIMISNIGKSKLLVHRVTILGVANPSALTNTFIINTFQGQ
jgi:hypothetical protein